MKRKRRTRAGGAGGHSSLTFNHRQADALGCEQNKSDRCGLLKSNIIWGDYHTERHGESSAQRETREEFGCSAKCRLVLFGTCWQSILRLTRSWHRCPVPSPGTRSPGEPGKAFHR